MATGAGTAAVTADDVARARPAVLDVVVRTPVLRSAALSDRCAADVVLKAESLQRTGSFKLRGALAKIAALGPACERGVTAGSAGNHGWALSAAAATRAVPCEVFMPEHAPLAKIEGCDALGATVRVAGESIEDALTAARRRADEAGMTFVHPFDDPVIVAGQGTLGLELLEDVRRLAKIIVPVGGGGLVSGVAIAVKSARPDVEVVGVQVEAAAAYPASLRGGSPVTVKGAVTIADGIAVKRPGDVTLPLVREWVDDVVVVGEDEVAEAMVLLVERARLVVEGAGAVGVAALLGGHTRAAEAGTTCVVLSGGNVDAGLLASVARRHETEAGRRLVLFSRVPDRPGALARMLTQVAEAGANLVDVEHLREGVDLHVRETGVQLVLETRGRDHAAQVVDGLRAAGYDAVVVR
jgi:threonine dehydratase